jgi:hypothetical protein
MSVKVGEFGRIVLPKSFGKNAEMNEGTWLIISGYMGLICLVPVKMYNSSRNS